MSDDEIDRLIPKGESLVTKYQSKIGNVTYVMTRDFAGLTYVLYDCRSGKLKRCGKGDNPIKLEEKYSVFHTIA